ncbi:MAG: hypothetical protein BroJett021_25120 [Chloroflexota bacterium]|nr:MAG: hypothetical protein BroJett021_25120 [Chloroflexota bacterium]
MSILDAQREMRRAFLGGFAGQLIAGVIWAASAAFTLLAAPNVGIAVLFFGSMAIFPLTQGLLRLIGRPAKVGAENGLWALGAQIAFTVPLNFLLVFAATFYRHDWFYPAAMIAVGAHYLPFVTLYGMRMFAVLGALLVGAGTALAMVGTPFLSFGGWLGAALLIAFALIGRWQVLAEERGLNFTDGA